MGLLDGQLASAIYAGFKGKLLVCALRQASVVESGGLNELGDPITVNPTSYGCQGFTEDYDEAYRLRAGIPLTDLKVCLFAKSLPAGVKPAKDDLASVTRAGVATWYQLRRVATDPATALWTCQAYETAAPDGG